MPKFKWPIRWVRQYETVERRNEEILKQYKAGRLLHEIALDFDLSPSTISEIAKKAGEPPRQNPKPSLDDLIQVYKKTGSKLKTARHFGIGEAVVRRMLRSVGF